MKTKMSKKILVPLARAGRRPGITSDDPLREEDTMPEVTDRIGLHGSRVSKAVEAIDWPDHTLAVPEFRSASTAILPRTPGAEKCPSLSKPLLHSQTRSLPRRHRPSST
jgi:hypothetical protein